MHRFLLYYFCINTTDYKIAYFKESLSIDEYINLDYVL